MRTYRILSTTIAFAFAIVSAQAANTPAAGATPGAAATSAKPKPLSMNETKAVGDILQAMHFHIQMGEVGKYNKDKQVSEFAQKAHKEMTEQFTPLVNYAMNNGVENKNIPTEVSKADKNDIDKLKKEKEDKWTLEYFELLAKNGKRNARAVEAAAKTLTSPEAKGLAEKVLALINGQVAHAETAHKDLKAKK